VSIESFMRPPSGPFQSQVGTAVVVGSAGVWGYGVYEYYRDKSVSPN